MELFGIAFAAIAGLALAPAYCLMLLLVWRFRLPRIVARRCAYAVLALALLDVILVSWLGAIRVREVVGAPYFLVHLFAVVCAAPALAVALVLNESKPRFLHAIGAAVASYIVGLGAIFFQIAVAEALFGIDGLNGPYKYPF